MVTPDQAADSPRFTAVLDRVKAYSSRANHAYLRRRQIQAAIPVKADQAANRKKLGSKGGRPVSHDAGLYKERNTVERGINKIKE
ncbi:hypothetical protein FHS38_006974 [Streptomyces netropsis]|uniref:Transposase DDE domain-containing protein n=1 Tax=Streptomyces netropsis TaxID=55404 RepID=A0A7W7LJT6_STRNE|nr:hypothetical protein [Streptomyces netropsis]GGR53709.1 hypothetical protein GCM10010219_68000 [Streptomyces netropsis]